MTLLRNLTAASVALVMATPASAMVIDLFNGSQVAEIDGVGAGTPASQAADGDVLGGFRDLSVSTTSANAGLGTSLVVAAGRLSFSNDDGVAGSGTVTYDGDDDPSIIDDDGLGGGLGVDLTFGIANPAFFFDITSGDGTFEFSARVTDVLGNVGTFEETIEFTSPDVLAPGISEKLPLAVFAFQGVDLTQVGSVSFGISSDVPGSRLGIDGSIGSISVVPLPASSLLLLGSVGGVFGAFAAVGRRRRRAA